MTKTVYYIFYSPRSALILVKSDISGKKSFRTRKIGSNGPIFQFNNPNSDLIMLSDFYFKR
jgi:hypothetical protein